MLYAGTRPAKIGYDLRGLWSVFLLLHAVRSGQARVTCAPMTEGESFPRSAHRSANFYHQHPNAFSNSLSYQNSQSFFFFLKPFLCISKISSTMSSDGAAENTGREINGIAKGIHACKLHLYPTPIAVGVLGIQILVHCYSARY